MKQFTSYCSGECCCSFRCLGWLKRAFESWKWISLRKRFEMCQKLVTFVFSVIVPDALLICFVSRSGWDKHVINLSERRLFFDEFLGQILKTLVKQKICYSNKIDYQMLSPIKIRGLCLERKVSKRYLHWIKFVLNLFSHNYWRCNEFVFYSFFIFSILPSIQVQQQTGLYWSLGQKVGTIIGIKLTFVMLIKFYTNMEYRIRTSLLWCTTIWLETLSKTIEFSRFTL